jgi:AAA+ ATPase superfamily predicted ATPase
MNSPFVFGRIASGNAFVNRTGELKHLKDNFTSGINTMLISPRRWGKTSLVTKAAQQAGRSNRDLKVCYLDLFRIQDENSFFEAYASAVLRASASRWQEWASAAKELLGGLVSSISIGTDPVNDFSLKLSWNQGSKEESKLLALPERIAAKKKLKFLICIDEFQKIDEFKDSEFLQQKLRSHWQEQARTTYCLYGSKRHIITRLFDSQAEPFYRFGDLIFLKKIEERHWRRYIKKQFERSGKKIDGAVIEDIIGVTANHPYHIQQLSHYLWRLTDTEANQDVFRRALDELLINNEILFRREVESVTPLQLRYLKALVNKEMHISSAKVIRDYQLGSPGNLSTIKSALETKEIIDFFEKEPAFVNPLFEYWLRHHFFESPR